MLVIKGLWFKSLLLNSIPHDPESSGERLQGHHGPLVSSSYELSNSFLLRLIRSQDFCRFLTCCDQDLVVAITVWYMCMCLCVHVSKFVRTITSTTVDGFQNNLTQLFSITCRCAFWNIGSGRHKVKVTLEGQIFVQTITSTIVDGFQNNLTQFFSITCRCAIWNIGSVRSKVKVTGARWVVLAQPYSL